MLDLVVNSSGLTDFNPDLARSACGQRGRAHELAGIYARQQSRRAAASFHLLRRRQTRWPRARRMHSQITLPAGVADFDAEREWKSLEETIRNVEARAQSPEMTAALRRQALGRRSDPSKFPADEVG